MRSRIYIYALSVLATLSTHTEAVLPTGVAAESEPTDAITLLCGKAEALGERMREAIRVLQAIHDKDSAEAAIPYIRAVKAAEKEFDEVCTLINERYTTEELYRSGPLPRILRSIPAAVYNRLLQEQTAAVCHGSVRLFLEIAGRTNEFRDEEIDVELTEEEKATLEMVRERVLAKLPVIPDAEAAAFLAAIDETADGVARLQNSAAGLMHWHALIRQHRKQLNEFYDNCFNGHGAIIMRCTHKPDNYFADLYSKSAHQFFFLYYGDNDQGTEAANMRKTLWDDAEEKLAEFRRKYGLQGGDGRTAETAFIFPPEITEADMPDFVTLIVHEVFGQEHDAHTPLINRVFADPQGNTVALQVPLVVGVKEQPDKSQKSRVIISYMYIKLPTEKK